MKLAKTIITLFFFVIAGNIFAQNIEGEENTQDSVKKEEKKVEKDLDKEYIEWAKTLSYKEKFLLAKSWYLVAEAYKKAGNDEKYVKAHKRALEISPFIEYYFKANN